MNLDGAKREFVNESLELLENMQDALLAIENDPQNSELINAMFRAAHTIKGNAGIFGFEDLQEFTHVVENVLDRIRNSELRVDTNLIAVLLGSHDLMKTLVEHTVGEAGGDPALLTQARHTLLEQLRPYAAAKGKSAPNAAQTLSIAPSHDDKPCCGNDCWHISIRFSKDSLRNGMDPLSFLRYMEQKGRVADVSCITDDLPRAEQFDAENCYLGLEIRYDTKLEKQDIAKIFEFIREDSAIHILPPRAKMTEYAQLIEELPEDNMKLGKILVACGALTEKELQDALDIQSVKAFTESAAAQLPIGEVLVQQKVVHPEIVNAALHKQQKEKEQKSASNRSIRVDADKLDALINMVGELVIAGATANLLAQSLGDENLTEAVSSTSRLVDQIRDGALRLRMVQIGDTFSKFQRVVRDVSKELGKDIRLEISGAETELDKSVVEKIGDPLMHLVRNAMDHGIESAVERTANGKSAQGCVHLNAYHDSGSIIIEVIDDGRGLNKDKLVTKAIERNLIAPDHNLSDQEIYQLIFEPGFSTAERVTNLSGRGVGMDVVRRNIEALRGTVDIDTELNTGTTIRIRLPLTLAIIDSFLVKVADAAFVIPLDLVVECLELTSEERARTYDAKGYINLRGAVLPYLRLRHIFACQGSPGKRENVMVVQHGQHQVGLVVDELVGESQSVIKPLGRLFNHLKGISGSTILGSGDVALIVDVPTLIQLAISKEATSLKQAVA